MARGSRPAWHLPVLVIAGLLVVAQAIAFIWLRSKKNDNNENKSALGSVASGVDASVTTSKDTPDATIAPAEATALMDAAAPIVEPSADAAAAVAVVIEPKPVPVEKKVKKPTRAELLAQQKKEREEDRREEQERAAQQERERRKLEQERVAVERARAEAEAERQRLARDKVEAEAAARAAAEKARLEALAKERQTPVTEPKVDVLVLVFGPGTPSMSMEQIRNVYLGRASVWPNGTTARPLNRPGGTAAGRKFFGGVLKMSSGAFVEHWSELQLSGGGIAPGVVSSGKTVVAKVAATNGGFGYVMESELPADTSGVRLVRLK